MRAVRRRALATASSTRSSTTSRTTRRATPAAALRTSRVAVNDAPLVGATRDSPRRGRRVVCGLSMLSAGTPMFFMGEEIVAQKPYQFDNIATSKEDLARRAGGRRGADVPLLPGPHPPPPGEPRRPLAPHRHRPRPRREPRDRLHAAAGEQPSCSSSRASTTTRSLDGYVIQTEPDRLPAGRWQEIFNSDAGLYGGEQRRQLRRRHPVRRRPDRAPYPRQRGPGPAEAVKAPAT